MHPEALDLLREASKLGARFAIGADGQLIVIPEEAVRDDLRERLFAVEKECVAAVQRVRAVSERFDDFVRIASQADLVSGARYALIPTLDGDVDLAIFSIRSPLPPWLWIDLQNMREGIIDSLEMLGLVGMSVDLAGILRAVDEYDQRGERPQ